MEGLDTMLLVLFCSCADCLPATSATQVLCLMYVHAYATRSLRPATDIQHLSLYCPAAEHPIQ